MITEGIREEVDKTVCLLTHSTPFYVFMNKRVVMIACVVARSIARLKQAIKKSGTLTLLS